MNIKHVKDVTHDQELNLDTFISKTMLNPTLIFNPIFNKIHIKLNFIN